MYLSIYLIISCNYNNFNRTRIIILNQQFTLWVEPTTTVYSGFCRKNHCSPTPQTRTQGNALAANHVILATSTNDQTSIPLKKCREWKNLAGNCFKKSQNFSTLSNKKGPKITLPIVPLINRFPSKHHLSNSNHINSHFINNQINNHNKDRLILRLVHNRNVLKLECGLEC